MRCIFCRQDTSASRSVEHIIPESLGNTEHVLPRGTVCDRCNQYFSIKVEGPLLGSPFFRHLRFRQRIVSKKGRIPPLEDLLTLSGTGIPLGLGADPVSGWRHLYTLDPKDEVRFVEMVRSDGKFTTVAPIPRAPDDALLSRFLAKVGMEVYTHRVMKLAGWETEVFRPEFDEICQFARFGRGPRVWPYHARQIYPEGHVFQTPDFSAPYEVLHEFGVLYTETRELYVIVAIFGVEFAINLGGPMVDGYRAWLESNGQRSPLYPEGGP